MWDPTWAETGQTGPEWPPTVTNPLPLSFPPLGPSFRFLRHTKCRWNGLAPVRPDLGPSVAGVGPFWPILQAPDPIQGIRGCSGRQGMALPSPRRPESRFWGHFPSPPTWNAFHHSKWPKRIPRPEFWPPAAAPLALFWVVLGLGPAGKVGAGGIKR